MYDLKGKVAIVTGGLGYLAFEFVSALAQNGANVVIADLSESKCKEKAKEISEQTGNRALRIKVDITNKRSIENMTDEVIKEFNKIDVLVNAAQAVTKNDYAPFEELTLEDWETALSNAPKKKRNQFQVPKIIE